MQEDPIGFWGGVNFYTYCDNNPINWIDPWGWCNDKEEELPSWVIIVGGISITTPIVGDELIFWIIVTTIGGYVVYQADRGYQPEPYPGFTRGKTIRLLRKHIPTPAPPSHNPPPPPLPPLGWWQQLLEKLADLLSGAD